MARAVRYLTLAAILAVVFGAGYWAARSTLSPPAASVSGPGVDAEYVVKEGEVERKLQFTARAEWPSQRAGVNSRSGVVTRVFLQDGGRVEEGSRLYAVNERPVVVALGVVPAYRDLSAGATGQDVRQLQGFLKARGFFTGLVDGQFGSLTANAVQAWQTSLGVEDDGIVLNGDLIFVRQLPSRLTLAKSVAVGEQLSVGTETVLSLAAAPKFVVPLSQDQADLVPSDVDVIVKQGAVTWRGRVARARTAADGSVSFELAGPNGRPLCRKACATIPTSGVTQYPVEFAVVPKTRGPLVPAAALQVDASGATFVETVDGSRVEVTVRAADAGWSVIDGIEGGDRLRLVEGAS